MLDLYFKGSKGFRPFVIVIGANNGRIKDFITPYLDKGMAQGVLVEPVKHLFHELKGTFPNVPNLYFENSAIGRRKGRRRLYRLNETSASSSWVDGLGSFNRNNIVLHHPETVDPQRYIVKETVHCLTFSALLDKYDVKALHILQIDTEGTDYEILISIDFQRIRPDIIIFEFLHLTHYQYFSAINFLEMNNYEVNRDNYSMDMIAIDKGIL
jgi:FkbM family methyltransferase